MRFYSPFDDVQFDGALQTHREMRVNLAQLRERYPPRSRRQRELLRRYRDVVRLFRDELLGPRGKIDPDVLNELSATAAECYVEYVMRRGVR